MDQQVRAVLAMVNIQRSAIKIMINNTLLSWYYTDRMVGGLMEKFNWLPEEGRKVFREWVTGNKESFVLFWNGVDDGFNNLGSSLVGRSKVDAPKTGPPEIDAPPAVESAKTQRPCGLLEFPLLLVHHEPAAKAESLPGLEAPHEEKAENQERERPHPWIVRGY